MSEKLTEAGFLTVDIGSVISPPTPEKSENSEQKIRRLLKELLIEKKGLDESAAKPVVGKLMSLGDPFRKLLKVLGFNIDPNEPGTKNPLLAFLVQKEVREGLLLPGLINLSTFKALYNAVANNLVADSEFFGTEGVNDYNLIYCPKLYYLSAKEIEEYLTLQRGILRPSKKQFSEDDQIKNRKTFLEMPEISELDVVKRAAEVNNSDIAPPTVQKAEKLNSLKLAKQICGKSASEYDELGSSKTGATSKKLDVLVSKLKNLESKFAAILLLCSKNAELTKEATGRPEFKNLNQEKVTQAFIALSGSDIVPKGQLSKESAAELIQKILATLETQQ